jgi:hypothetical protein
MRGNDVYVVVQKIGKPLCLAKRETDLWTDQLQGMHLFYSFDEADKARSGTSFKTAFVAKLR